MKKSTMNVSLLVIGILFLGGVIIAVNLYNKGPINVADGRAIDTDPVSLYRSYITDSVAAHRDFDGKILRLTGEVVGVTQNLQKEQVLFLKTLGGGNINCTMEKPAPGITTGKVVTVKGICSGLGQGDTELGIAGDVYLTRTVITE